MLMNAETRKEIDTDIYIEASLHHASASIGFGTNIEEESSLPHPSQAIQTIDAR
jgi:hypothetical protein